MTDRESFLNFNKAAANGITAVKSWTSNIIHSVNHVIKLQPTVTAKGSIDTSSRFFASLEQSMEYHEVDADFLELCEEKQAVEFLARSCFTCLDHGMGYQLSKYERQEVIKEACGLKNPELSPQQFSREKRKIMVRKLSYGRKDEIQEMVRRLSSGSEELIELDYELACLCKYYPDFGRG